jgi:hypothetical protein
MIWRVGAVGIDANTDLSIRGTNAPVARLVEVLGASVLGVVTRFSVLSSEAAGASRLSPCSIATIVLWS